MKKISTILILFIVNLNSFAQTTINSNVSIDQAWVNAHSAGPWTIAGSSVTVTFESDLRLYNNSQYFIITGSNVVIDGADKKVTLDGILDFEGLVNASDDNASNAVIKNIGVNNSSFTTLKSLKGYISGENNKASITHCYSTGVISNIGTAGIVGYYNEGNISYCYSTGAISNYATAGIAGPLCFGSISNCYSTGEISGEISGGITTFGYYYYPVGSNRSSTFKGIGPLNNNLKISNCYSTGAISGLEAGGITGLVNILNINNCYSTGTISGFGAGGIACFNISFSDNSEFGNISNCYTSGQIKGDISAGIAVINAGSIVNSRTSGSVTGNDANGIVVFNVDYNTITGTISNSENVTPAIANTWDNTIAAIALTDLGTVWNTNFSPYRILNMVKLTNFANPGPITICQNGSYYLAPSTTDGTWATSSSTLALADTRGYVTGVSKGNAEVSFSNYAGTVSASVTVGSSSELIITDPLAQASYKFNNNPQGPIGGINNYVGYNGFDYSSQSRPIRTGYYRASKQSGQEAGCPYEYYIYKCTSCGNSAAYATRPQGSLTGNTIQAGSEGQLTYTSTNGGGPFTIVYLPSGGSNVTITNVTSGSPFSVGNFNNSKTFNLISVTDENTKASTDFSGSTATIAVIPPSAELTGTTSICTGSIANLSLATTGTGSITVTLSDGTIINTISGTTTISVSPTTTASYSITSITDTYGNSGSATSSLTVTVFTPASISVQPISPITIIEGTTTTLSVTATGDAPLAFQWYQNDAAIVDANNDSYTTTNTLAAAGTYYVTVSNTCNVISSTSIIVNVTPLPIPQGSLSGGTIILGSTGQLTYTSSNGSSTFTIVYNDGSTDFTVTNVISGQAFNVASGTPTSTTNYTLVSVKDELTTRLRTLDFTTPTATITVLTSVNVGDLFGGGIIAYILQPLDPGYDANTPHGLIAATVDQSTGIKWSLLSNPPFPITGATATALGTGFANTNTIITIQEGTPTSYAAGLARAYRGGGFDDWYLPSKDELNQLYLNKAVVEGLNVYAYWSSSENGSFPAWLQVFNDGETPSNEGRQISNGKDYALGVRAIRSF